MCLKILFAFGLTLSVVFANFQLLPAQDVDSSMPPHLRRMAEAMLAKELKSESETKDQLFRATVFEFVRYNQTEVIKALIRRGFDPTIRDQDDHSLLHISAWNGALEMSKILIESGCDVDALDGSGRAPLFGAASSNRYAIAELLLKKGADVNGNSKHNSPLCGAAWFGYPEMVKLLLANHADLNRADSDGNQALHKSVWQANVEIVELLIAAGANKQTRNKIGQTPISIAAERWKEKKGSQVKRSWGPEQAIGPPDALAGDNANAWASKTPNAQQEWLVVYFADAVVPMKVVIYENLGPKAVQRITVFDKAGLEQTVWKGVDPAKPNAKGVHVATIGLDAGLTRIDPELKINKLKIYIDSPGVPVWNEIDAVGLIDQQGNKHWASWVDASTTYASGEYASMNHRRILRLLGTDGQSH